MSRSLELHSLSTSRTVLRRAAGWLSTSLLALGAAVALSAPAIAAAEGAPSLNSSPPYTVKIDSVLAKKGQPATARVVFGATGGRHVNVDYPTGLTLKAPAGVTLAKDSLKKPDAKLSEQQGQFDVVLTASEVGKKSVTGELKFAVCDATTCEPQRVQVAIAVDVK